ncbi:hypothetical protein [Bacillus subtilis]|uniref:Uncharacterized protein n=1 Tax=Bacillus subtilis TaxID=1423 RepID=A0A8I2B898_BACIU|nr:hypothetical protein [Bacillus subtilis]KAF2421616.1 hypothetical protein B6K89_20690 [Bacillus subtilis]MBO3794188.1 hypothetical protein [Bacillus subtilis]
MKAVITLEDTHPAKVEIEKSGAKRTIYVNMQDLANHIVSSVKMDEVEDRHSVPEVILTSPSLPLNTVKYAKLSDDTDLLFMTYPETSVDVTYHKTVFYDVPFPNLVFCFGVTNNRVSKHMLMAYKDRFLREDTQLYRFPFSNVFGDGGMCYHDNSIIHDLVQLQSFPHNWIKQPFNDHLFQQGNNNLLDQPLRELFEQSQSKQFNYDMLRPMGMTFADWTNKILN